MLMIMLVITFCMERQYFIQIQHNRLNKTCQGIKALLFNVLLFITLVFLSKRILPDMKIFRLALETIFLIEANIMPKMEAGDIHPIFMFLLLCNK